MSFLEDDFSYLESLELRQFLTRLWEGETSLSYQPPPGFKAGLVAHGDETDGFWEGKDGGRVQGLGPKTTKKTATKRGDFSNLQTANKKTTEGLPIFFPKQKSNCSQFSLGGWVFLGRKLEVI